MPELKGEQTYVKMVNQQRIGARLRLPALPLGSEEKIGRAHV